MKHGRDSSGWLSVAADLGKVLARSPAPITFVLGAGCSLSSGCPATAVIQAEFEKATAGRFPSNARNVLHEVLPQEQVQIVSPLFEGVRPYVGYLSLAALARTRHVLVLNLNWDRLVEAACSAMNVPCRAFDLKSRPADFDVAKLTTRGLTCVHLHGTIDSDPRFASLSTLKFDSDEQALLTEAFALTTVIVGTTLVADTDMTQLLLAVARARGASSASMWQFMRQGPAPVGGASFTSLPTPLLGAAGFYTAAGPDVDFDRLMTVLLGESRGLTFDKFRADQPAIELPTFEQLIWPSRTIFAQCIPAKALVVMTGEPQLGKSTAAHLLAYLYILWREQDPNAVAFRSFEEPHATVAALGSLASTPGIYLLSDPFGATRVFEPNPGFAMQLDRFTGSPGGSNVIVVSRLTNWIQGADRAAHAPLLPSDAESWYEKRALRSAALAVAPDRTDLSSRIDRGELDTPARLTFALRGDQFAANYAPQADVVQHKLDLLNQRTELAFLCSLVRLQEFAATHLSKQQLEAIAHIPADLAGQADTFLATRAFEEKTHLILRHATDKEAIDKYLVDSADVVEGTLRNERPLHAADLLEALKVSRILHRLRQGDHEAISGLNVEEVQRWCAALFTALPSTRTLDLIKIERLDPWAMVDLAYEVVRLWPILHDAGAGHQVLEGFAAHRRGYGTYALLEACLYLGDSVSQEVHSAIQSALWRLLSASDQESKREALLIVDAFAWRPMPAAYRDWLNKFVQRNKVDATWTGFRRFCEAYHPDGLIDLIGPFQFGTGPLTNAEAEVVSWLVRWHFIHQAHSRTLLLRSRTIDKDFLCRSLHADGGQGPTGALDTLISALASHDAHRGWAFHLGCNAMALGRRVSDETKRQMDSSVGFALEEDLGITLAALTYETAVSFRALRGYFGNRNNRDRALEVLRSGVTLDGVLVRPPRFSHVRNPTSPEQDFAFKWPALWKHEVTTLDLNALTAKVLEAAEQLIAQKAVPADVAYKVVETVARGDLRELEDAVVAREAIDDLYLHMVRAAVELRLRSQPTLL